MICGQAVIQFTTRKMKRKQNKIEMAESSDAWQISIIIGE